MRIGEANESTGTEMPMPQHAKWPFTPLCLSEIIDRDTLSVIESGGCERLGGPLTLLDRDPQTGKFSYRIDSVNLSQRWQGFCRLFRDRRRVQGGDDACRECDLQEAETSLQEYRRRGNVFRTFTCHMGLQDVTYIVRISDQPVALL